MSVCNKDRLTAAVITVLVMILFVALLVGMRLKYDASAIEDVVAQDSAEMLFEGQYVRIGEVPYATPDAGASGDESLQTEASIENVAADTEQEPAPAQVTTKDESPMKVDPPQQVKAPQPTAEEIAARERSKREREAAARIAGRVAFGSGNGATEGSGNSGGTPDGNAAKGATGGRPGHSLAGRTLDAWSLPKGSLTGTIVVAVSVDRQGRVTQADYHSGNGPIAADKSAREACRGAARGSRFSVSTEAPERQRGTITYIFK